MNPYPTRLERTDDGCLFIEWSDSQRRRYRFQELREACPCATCREKRRGEAEQPQLLPVLSPQETQPLTIAGMKPIGNYAYGISFSDGHDTGIFTIELLRELGEPV